MSYLVLEVRPTVLVMRILSTVSDSKQPHPGSDVAGVASAQVTADEYSWIKVIAEGFAAVPGFCMIWTSVSVPVRSGRPVSTLAWARLGLEWT